MTEEIGGARLKKKTVGRLEGKRSLEPILFSFLGPRFVVTSEARILSGASAPADLLKGSDASLRQGLPRSAPILEDRSECRGHEQ